MIIVIVFRLKTFSSAGFNTNPTLLQGEFIVWTQTELNYSLISATIPCLRPFITNLATHYGGFGRSHHTGGSYGTKYGSHNASTNQSFQMNILKSTDRHAISHDQTVVDTRHLVGTSTDHRTKTNTGHVGKKGIISKPLDSHGGQEDSRRTSIGSNDSQRMIIRKDITWTVE